MSLNIRYILQTYDVRQPISTSEFSIPSLLLSHGASVSSPQDCCYLISPYTKFCIEGSHLAYLMPLPNYSTLFRTEFLKHLDMDGILELTSLDRWLTSILYHTSADFKKSLLICLEIKKDDILPTGILAFPEICKELKAARADDREHFFEKVCAYGTRDTLKPFIGAGLDAPQQSLDWPEERNPMKTCQYHLSTIAFQNMETFELLAAVGIRISRFRVVLEVMSCRFILERFLDRAFLDLFFGLWSPSSELRPLVLSHWLQFMQEFRQVQFEDAEKGMINVLIERDYCSFPNGTSPTPHSKRATMFLGAEVAWQVCMVIKPLEQWKRGSLREERMTLLLHILEQYRPFVDLELDRRWLPPKLEERWLGFTPLMLAVAAGDLRLAMLLVEYGAIITRPHTSQNLSALDLALRNKSCYHPRNWLGLPPSELAEFWLESVTMVAEETDEKILEFLVEKSRQSQVPVNHAKPKTDAKFHSAASQVPHTESTIEVPTTILQALAICGRKFSDVCRDYQLEWRRRTSGRDFLRRILPRWLFPYTEYLGVSLEDAAFLLLGFASCLAANVLRTVPSRPALRQICFVMLILFLRKLIW